MLKQKRNVAIVVDSFTQHGREILSGIGDYVQENKRWSTQYMEYSLETAPPAWLESWKGDGIIVRDKLGRCCDAALAAGIAVVDLSVARRPDTPTVISDHPMSVRFGLNHLRERGFNRFAFVGVSGMSFSEDRRNAFVKQTEEKGYLFTLESFNLSVYPWKMDRDKLEHWLVSLPKPIGILAAFDPVGIYLLEACAAKKIAVPDEVGVIGVNNDEIQCKLVRPSLSSVVLDARKLGYHACLLLDELMDGHSPPVRPTVIPVLGVAARQSTDTLKITDPFMIRVIRYIRENATSGIDVDQIAGHFGCTTRTLERRFRKELGVSPASELTEARIHYAEDLLRHSNLILEVVATRCGFDSVSHFSMLFKRKTGLSLGDFRKKEKASQRKIVLTSPEPN